MIARLDAGGRHGDDARLGREPLRRRAAASEASRSAAAPSLTPEALPAVTVQLGAVDAFELRQLLDGRAGARMLVGVDDDRVALLLRDRHRHDLLGEAAGFLRRRPARLAAGGEGVLVGAADLVVSGDIVRRLAASNRQPKACFIFGLTKRQPMVVS